MLLAAVAFAFGLVRAVASEIAPLDPAAQQAGRQLDTVIYAAPDAAGQRRVLAILRGDESRVLVGWDDIAPVMRQAIVVDRGPPLLRAPRRRSARHRPSAVAGPPHAEGRRGRLDDHAAVRQERLHPQRADDRAQGARGGARLAARAALVEGADPDRVPEHDLLRQRRLRQSSRRRAHTSTRARNGSRSPRRRCWPASRPIPRSTTRRSDPCAAKARRNYVLQRMFEDGKISAVAAAPRRSGRRYRIRRACACPARAALRRTSPTTSRTSSWPSSAPDAYSAAASR